MKECTQRCTRQHLFIHTLTTPSSLPPLADSAWALQSQALAESKAADEEEVVMVEGPAFLEGLSSNFFALVPAPATSGMTTLSDVAASSSAEHYHLLTAREGVLIGTVRQLVLDACRLNRPLGRVFPRGPTPAATTGTAAGAYTATGASDGGRDVFVDVVERAPSVDSVDGWVGCAVTSTSRLYLPVKELRFNDPSVLLGDGRAVPSTAQSGAAPQQGAAAAAHPPRSLRFDAGPGSVSALIQQRVRELVVAQSEAIP